MNMNNNKGAYAKVFLNRPPKYMVKVMEDAIKVTYIV